MISQTVIFQPEKLISLCAICISDRSGGKIALLIIIFSLIALFAGIGLGRNIFQIKINVLNKNNSNIY